MPSKSVRSSDSRLRYLWAIAIEESSRTWGVRPVYVDVHPFDTPKCGYRTGVYSSVEVDRAETKGSDRVATPALVPGRVAATRRRKAVHLLLKDECTPRVTGLYDRSSISMKPAYTPEVGECIHRFPESRWPFSRRWPPTSQLESGSTGRLSDLRRPSGSRSGFSPPAGRRAQNPPDHGHLPGPFLPEPLFSAVTRIDDEGDLYQSRLPNSTIISPIIL